MSSAPYHLSIGAARADALFTSVLQRSDQPSRRQVRRAIAMALGAYGPHGCAARVAQSYGEQPETAASRMRWARIAAADAYGAPRSRPAHAPDPDTMPVTRRAAAA